MHKLLAQGQFGQIVNPFATVGGPAIFRTGTNGEGLFTILNVFFKMAIVMAAIYTLFNLIVAGYGFMSAGGDQKAVTKAWDRIWQSLIGLLVVAGSLIIAVIIGYLVFGQANWDFLISPRVFSP